MVEHYDRWLEKLGQVRGEKSPSDDAPFVGPDGFSCPRESANRFEARFSEERSKPYDAREEHAKRD